MFMMPFVSCEKELQPELEVVFDPSSNTTDVAVTGIVEKRSITYAVINGAVNLGLLPPGCDYSSFGVELSNGDSEPWKEEAGSEALEDRKFSVECDSLLSGTKYKYRTFVVSDDTTYYGEYKDFTTVKLCTDANHIHAVDLGLSVKWACCNVDATSPEGYGGYYAWGETEVKDEYSDTTYVYMNSDTTYVNIGNNICGSNYDVARVKWGGKWRMPNKNEIRELCTKCTWQWEKVNGVNGQLVIGPNGNSIFLPAAGGCNGTDIYARDECGYYWTGELDADSEFAVCYLGFNNTDRYWEFWYMRPNGRTIRPVMK